MKNKIILHAMIGLLIINVGLLYNNHKHNQLIESQSIKLYNTQKSNVLYKSEINRLNDENEYLDTVQQARVIALNKRLDELHLEILNTYYIEDIPLEQKEQQFIYKQCTKYGIPYDLMLGMISLESNFNPKEINTSNKNGTIDFGLCQLNSCNINTLNEYFERELDYLNFYDNVEAGIYHFSKSYDSYNIEKSLLVYNRGANGARKYYNKYLTYNESYVKIVLSKMNSITNMRGE